jgi:hypothetical protein
MTKEEAQQLIIQAAKAHVEHLRAESRAFTYANIDPMESTYRKALEVYEKCT